MVWLQITQPTAKYLNCLLNLCFVRRDIIEYINSHYIVEILLKLALYTNQSINQLE